MQYERLDFQTYGLDVEVYDERYAVNDPLQEGDVEFYQEYALKYGVKPNGGPVLELGSGTGRITLELAKLGCEVVGIDISQKMIEIAEGKQATLKSEFAKNVTFLEDDMCTFELNDHYPLIIIPARALQCLPTEQHQKKALENCYKHLTEGGRLIVDVFDPQFDEYTEQDLEQDLGRIPTMTHPETGNKVEMEYIGREGVPNEQAFREIWRYKEVDAQGRTIRMHDTVMRMRWALRDQMERMFKRIGYEVEHLYSDFKKSAPAYGKEQIWILKKSASQRNLSR